MGDGNDNELDQGLSAARPKSDVEDRLTRALVQARLFGTAAEPVRVDRYVVTERVGAGAMGTVFKAYDPADPRGAEHPVALKILTGAQDAAFERFEREASALRGVHHPNVVGYLDHAALPGGSAWLAMEWVQGETLFDLLARRELSVEETVKLAQGIAAGLHAAHARGLVHRDIKPANLLLPGGDPALVKIADFGVARFSAMARLTKTGTAVGTPAYMAPEQAKGGDIDARADLFSVGAVLYECLSGRVPFPGQRAVSVVAALVGTDPTPVAALRPEVPEPLAALVTRLLSKAPADRVPSAMELMAGLFQIAPPATTSPAPVADKSGESLSTTDGITPLPDESPFVGRQRELGLLRGLWSECLEDSSSRVALVVGPAGIGKSRLVRELALGRSHPSEVALVVHEDVDRRAPPSSLPPGVAMVVATARSDADLPELYAAEDCVRVELSPLGRKACERMARAILPLAGADTVVDEIVSGSGGNPRRLEVLVGQARER